MAESSANVWHILTRTRGGTVSLLKNLDEATARQTMQRLRLPFDMGSPWSEWATRQRAKAEAKPVDPYGVILNCGSGSQIRISQPGDLEQVECFGPEGVSLVVWPKPDDYDARYAAMLAEEKAALQTPPAIEE